MAERCEWCNRALAADARPGSLPARVLEHLRARHGEPDFPAAIAEALRVRDAHVSGALTTLRVRCLVAVVERRGRRVYYGLAPQ